MLKGFGISGYRSFGPKPQYLAPLTKINLLVGRNNSGKSNVLRALPLIKQFARGNKPPSTFDPVRDLHKARSQATPLWHFPIFRDPASIKELTARILHDRATTGWENTASELLASLDAGMQGAVWFTFDPLNGALVSPVHEEISLRLVGNPISRTWASFWTVMRNGATGGGFREHHLPEVLNQLSAAALPRMKEVHEVGAHRQVGASGSAYTGLNGAGLIAHLLTLQHPELNQRGDLARFQKVNSFLQTVLESSDAQLDVPHSGNELLVHLDGKLLPIESLVLLC